jgi:hypothetical protein
MARRTAEFTTYTTPIGAPALVVALALGLIGVGYWVDGLDGRIQWTPPISTLLAEWRHVFREPLVESLDWLPGLFQFMFGNESPHWIYDYVAVSALTLIGTFIAFAPDLIKALPQMMTSEAEDEDQDRIADSLRRPGTRSRFKLGQWMAALFKGVGWVLAGGAILFFLWPVFLISVPFAFISIIRGRIGRHFVRSTFMMFSPAMFACVLVVVNYLVAMARSQGLLA